MCPEDGTPLRADSTVAIGIPVDPMIGRTLDDKYRLDEHLGIGGMGTVYRATHLLIDRPVAIKVLNPRFVEDEAAQERFRREARAAGRLRHTNAVAVTDFGRTSDGYVYIVMELLEGRTLRDVLAREAPLDIARSVSLMLQISAAVAAAHEAGIIHRDLKPANIFIVQRQNAPAVVKVLDFGIAKLAAETVDEAEANTLTQTGVMIGTPRYMSPEQCDGAKLTSASDVYSLGIILYEMLTGTTPFTGSSPLAVALKHSSQPPRRPSELVAGIPRPLEEVVLHALEKRPEERPPDAGAFRRELYALAERLGLEHAAAFSAPTIETLRNAGTETPSGRLVIDIERLRQNRAAAARTHETIVLADTKEEPEPQVSVEHAAPAVELGPSSARQGPLSQMRAAFGQRRSLLKRLPVALIGVCLALLFSIVGAVALFSTRHPADSTSSVNTNEAPSSPTPAREAEPAPSAPKPEPNPSVQEPKENESSEREEHGTQRYIPHSRRSEGVVRGVRPPRGGFLHKVKKIFKKPLKPF